MINSHSTNDHFNLKDQVFDKVLRRKLREQYLVRFVNVAFDITKRLVRSWRIEYEYFLLYICRLKLTVYIYIYIHICMY